MRPRGRISHAQAYITQPEAEYHCEALFPAGAMRPRNDTKVVGFARKPTTFISEMFEIRLAGAPYLATGYHTFGFKIATAAMRPRNDTNS